METHLLKVLFIEHIGNEKNTKDDKELKVKFYNYKGDLAKGEIIIETL